MTPQDAALVALQAEAQALTAVLDGLDPPAWEVATRCPPWRVRDVVGHVVTALGRVPGMIAAPAPPHPDTTATAYYRPDDRFSDTANADRVQTAHGRAATGDGTSLAADLAVTVHGVVSACRREPQGRVVRTRHGDAMLLSDFLTTRVVEVAVHGLDVADALQRPAWLTVSAAEHLGHLLFGPHWRHAVAELGWDGEALVRRTTGRGAVSADESAAARRLGLRVLTLG